MKLRQKRVSYLLMYLVVCLCVCLCLCVRESVSVCDLIACSVGLQEGNEESVNFKKL